MKAFSFVEILISVTLVSLALVAIFALLLQNLASAEDTRDRFVAANLAQEGVEIVVNFRSNNWAACPDALNPDNTLSMWRGVGGCIPLGDGSYIAQYNSLILAPANSANQSLARTNQGFYCHPSLPGCSGSPTLFSRLISISTPPGNDHQMKVVSTVSWMFHNQQKSVSVEDRLYNWR